MLYLIQSKNQYLFQKKVLQIVRWIRFFYRVEYSFFVYRGSFWVFLPRGQVMLLWLADRHPWFWIIEATFAKQPTTNMVWSTRDWDWPKQNQNHFITNQLNWLILSSSHVQSKRAPRPKQNYIRFKTLVASLTFFLVAQ